MASATIGRPSVNIRADVATSVADATIVHTGSWRLPTSNSITRARLELSYYRAKRNGSGHSNGTGRQHDGLPRAHQQLFG
jgi:hypothetical protein